MNVTNFALIFSSVWVSHCAEYSPWDQAERSSGLAKLFELGHQHLVAKYFFDFNEKERQVIHRLLAMACHIELTWKDNLQSDFRESPNMRKFLMDSQGDQ